jgi:hypothetical protein
MPQFCHVDVEMIMLVLHDAEATNFESTISVEQRVFYFRKGSS